MASHRKHWQMNKLCLFGVMVPGLDVYSQQPREGTRMNTQRIAAFAVSAVMSFGPAAALGQDGGPQRTPAQRAAALAERSNLAGFAAMSSLGASVIRVVGFVWTDEDTPVAYPRLAIRELTAGRVASRTTGTDLGEFRFGGLASGSYVVELWDDADRVQEVGQPLTVVAGDRVGTFLMVGGPSIIEEDFRGAVSDVLQSGAAANVSVVGGGNAASSER